MGTIRELAHQALNTGYLSLEAEKQLRQLLQTKYEAEDLNAFMMLQQAAMVGSVKQESREIMQRNAFERPLEHSKPMRHLDEDTQSDHEEIEIGACIRSVFLWHELLCTEKNSSLCWSS